MAEQLRREKIRVMGINPGSSLERMLPAGLLDPAITGIKPRPKNNRHQTSEDWNATYDFIKHRHNSVVKDLHTRIVTKADEFDDFRETTLREKRELRQQLEEEKLRHTEEIGRKRDEFQSKLNVTQQEHGNEINNLKERLKQKESELDNTTRELLTVKSKLLETQQKSDKTIDGLKTQLRDYESLIHK